MSRWLGLAVGLVLAATCASPADDELEVVAPPRVGYVYDEAGRLRAVVDPESDAALYRYDAVGNIVGVDRWSADALSLIEVSPARAEVGEEVVIHGTGFGDDPDDITVTFSGAESEAEAAVEVLSANALAVTVEVPVRVAAGPVTVTVAVGDDSAVLSDEFSVVPDRSPVIEGLPRVTAVGETVTIEGSNFSADPSLDAVVLGGASYGTVESATESSLVVRIPPAATTGRVSVATPDGSARSDEALFVAPEPWSAGDVEFTARAELGETTRVEIGKPDHVGLVVFEGRRGQRIGVEVADAAVGGNCVGFALRAPGGLELIVSDGAIRDTEWACGQDPEFPVLPPRLPVTGTYTLVVDGLSNEIESLDVTVEELSAEEWEQRSREERSRDGEGDDGRGDDGGGEGSDGRGEDGGDRGLPVDVGAPVPLEPGPVAQRDGPWAGDPRFPVDLSTGLFQSQQTDLVVDDVLPLVLGRSYLLTPHGVGEWAFGKGSALDFDLRLQVGSGRRIADLVLPNGVQIPYDRTTEGYDVETAVFEPAPSPTLFNGSSIVWNGAGWDLVLVGGTRLVFGDGSRAPLRAVRDPEGNQVIVRREADPVGRENGNVIGVYSPTGRHLALRYDDEDRVVEVSDHLGRTVGYGYDDQDRLVRVTYPDGGELGYGYDDDHRIVSLTGPGGAVLVTNAYDDEGRVVRQVLADGSTYGFGYQTDAAGVIAQTEVTDPAGVVRRIGFSDGYWTSDSVAVGTLQQQTITAQRAPGTQLVTALVDLAGRRTEYTYDELGSPTSITQLAGTPEAVTTEVTYDSDFHQIASVTDPAGRSVGLEYDRNGNRVAERGLYGETTYTYDRGGRLTSVTDPARATTEIGYELLHRTTVTDPRGHTRSEFYDAAGRLAVASDPIGRQSRVSYDELDRVSEVTSSGGATTSYVYDGLGQLTSIRDANGNVTGYGYDPVGRVVTRTDPLGAVDRYGYDAVGNLVAHTDRRGVVTTFSYDLLGRQSGAAFGVAPGGAGAGAGAGAESTIGFTYDLAGRVAEVVDSASGTVRLDYDDLDRLVGETTTAGRVTYGYDSAGRRTRMAVEGGASGADGAETTYAYDDVGLTEIAQGEMVASAARGDSGRLDGMRLPNDVAVDYRYDAAGALTGIDYRAGDDGLGSLGYRYDRAGRRVGITGSLAATDLPEPMADVAHGSGNRLTRLGGADGGGELVYDAAGNLLDDGTNTYTWNARGQLASIAGPVSASFVYDPFGRRSQKTIDGTTTAYLYDGPNVVQHRQGEDEPVTYLTGLGVDQVYARRDSAGEVTTYVADGLGSTIGLVDEDGEIATRYSRDPHGVTRMRGDDDANPFGFTGRELDETGLYYYRARYYAPETGRFISEDPLGHAAGDPNVYAYVGNDPTNFVDPSGQCIATALYYFNESFNLLDQMRALFDAGTNGQISQNELSARLDNISRQANKNLNDFLVICGAEVMAYEFLGTIVGAIRPTPAGVGGAGRVGPASRIGPTSRIGPSGGIARGGAPNTGSIRYGALDDLGRPTGVTARLTPDMVGTGSPAARGITPPGFGGGSAGHSRGHLLGNQLGGSGTDARNLVTMLQNPANSPVMSGFENQVRRALDTGQIINYGATPIYRGSELMPIGITLRAQGSGGLDFYLSVLNWGL